MSLARRQRIQPAFLYFAPAIDVVLTLTLFLVLSTGFLLQPGIAVQVPLSPFALAPVKNPALISLTGAPAPAVYFENEEVAFDELRERLLNRPPSASSSLVIKADRTVPYDKVVAVMNVALELGFSVVLATDEN